MDGPTLGLVGAVVGSTLGIAGGVIGTRASLRAARSGAERRYILRWALGCSAAIAAMLAMLMWLPDPYRWLVWIPYPLALTWGIGRCNADLARLRASAGESPDAS